MIKFTLKSARVQAGYTIREASKLIGCHFVTLARWEANPKMVKAKNQEAIATVYEIPIDQIKWE